MSPTSPMSGLSTSETCRMLASVPLAGTIFADASVHENPMHNTLLREGQRSALDCCNLHRKGFSPGTALKGAVLFLAP